MRRAVGVVVSAALLSGAVLAGSTPIAAAPARPPVLVEAEVGPWYPENEPTSPPAFDLTVACERNLRGGRREIVFGYESHVESSRTVPLVDTDGAIDRNAIIRGRRNGPGDIDPDGTQIAQFQPGSHPYAFAVAARRNETISWQVQVPAVDDFSAPWRAVVRTTRVPTCSGDEPERFAVVQAASVQVGPTDLEQDGDVITAWSAGVGVAGLDIACSDGGVPLEPQVLVGWRQPDDELAPLDSVEYVLTTLNGGVFEMSTVAARRMLDPRATYAFFGPPVDVTATCQFGLDAMAGEQTYWAGLPQAGTFTPILDADGNVVDFDLQLVLPGSVRIR